MDTNNQQTQPEPRESQKWGILGAFALLGIATAAVLILNNRRKAGQPWNIDDLFQAADRAADRLEHSIIGDQVRAS